MRCGKDIGGGVRLVGALRLIYQCWSRIGECAVAGTSVAA